MIRDTLGAIIRILDGTPAENQPKQGRGQSVVEMALIMPILLVLLAGIAEIGWFTNNYLILLSSTREGAREGTKATGQSDPYSWEGGTFSITQAVDTDGDDVPDDTVEIETSTRNGVYRVPEAAAISADAEQDALDLRMVTGIDYDLDDNDLVEPPEENVLQSLCRPERGQYNVGFYTIAACTAFRSMEPLDRTVYPNISAADDSIVRERLSLDAGDPIPRNDIVVSVFSLNLVVPFDEASATCTDADDVGLCEGFIQGLERPFEVNPNGGFTNKAETANGAQVMVSGRFPANANECADDHRDPFDMDGSGGFDPMELDAARLTVLNSSDDDAVLWEAGQADDRNQRGFVLTGRWAHDVLDSGGNLSQCFGSEWNLHRLEALVNLQGIPDTANPGSTIIREEDLNRLPERQGLVLVEIFWRHDLLLDLPFYGEIFRMMGSGGPGDDGNNTYIDVWAAFPVSTVTFDLEYDRTCDDILILDNAENETVCAVD